MRSPAATVAHVVAVAVGVEVVLVKVVLLVAPVVVVVVERHRAVGSPPARAPGHPGEGAVRALPARQPARTRGPAARAAQAAEASEAGGEADAETNELDLVGRYGGTVYTRVVARLLELARVVIMMEDWLRAVRPGEPFCTPGRL